MNPKVSVIIPVYNVEAYIKEMLLSVQGQSFNDFEAIIVNDGSTDGSQKIIDEFCATDDRFKCFVQENAGVASARNLGIEKATGKYIVFYDPDDMIPVKALFAMVKRAEKKDADIVVGNMQEINMGDKMLLAFPQKLASKRDIAATDPSFIRTWSLCNKMFSHKLITENNLRFESLLHAEDGLFLYNALYHAKKIVGCKEIVYTYIRRPFWHNNSATQIIDEKHILSLFKAHEEIIKKAYDLTQRLNESAQKRYMQLLYMRMISVGIINIYYRQIWRINEDCFIKLQQMLKIYKNNITTSQWLKILDENLDLGIKDNLESAYSLSKAPIVSIILSGNMTEKECTSVIESLYHQDFLRFELICSEEIFSYKNMKNVVTVNEDLRTKERMLKYSKGEYVIFVDEPIIFSKRTLKLMENKLRNNNQLDFVSVLVKQYDGKIYSSIPEINMSYGYSSRGKHRYNVLSDCDIFLSNKLIRKTALDDISLDGTGAEISQQLYRNKKFEKIRKGPMIVTAGTWAKLSSKCKRPSNIRIIFNDKKNTFISNTIDNLKRFITREDVDRLKALLKRTK